MRFPSLDRTETSKKSQKAECFIKCSSGLVHAAGKKERFTLRKHVKRASGNKWWEKPEFEYRDAPAILISQLPKAIKHKSRN